jgi:drug/metabolite transporter (DMT)-like permease
MIGGGLVAALAAALLLGSYLVAVKRYFSHYPPTLYLAVVHALALCWYLPALAATGSLAGLFPPLTAGEAGIVIGTVGLIAVALAAFYHALAVGDVSYVAPISKIVPVFVVPLEVALLGQRLAAIQIAGIGVATSAVYVANYRGGSLWAPIVTLRRRRAALFALASAAVFGVVDVGKRVSMQELAVPARGFVVLTLVLVPLALAPVALSRSAAAIDWQADRLKLAAAGAALAVGQHLVSVAFVSLPASVVSPVVNTQAVVAVVLGSLLLGEPHARRRLLAGGLAVAGVLLVSLG